MAQRICRAIRDKAVYLMDEWGKTIADDGFFGYRAPPHNPGHYIYEKTVGGLVDMYEYIGTENAVEYLGKITDWAEKNLDRSNPYALPSEWYTLSENLYRAYELTGDKRYFDFAKVWEYTDFWSILARGESPFREILKTNPKHESYHGYSHVNTLSSAAMAYRVTGDQHYLDTIVNAYQFLQDTQCFATGGSCPEEQLVVPDGLPETLVGIRRGKSNVDVRFHFETSCGSWAGFKLARYLQSFTGQAHYGDWIERLIYNGVGALIPMNDYGMIMYGSKYHLYGAQKSLFTVWFCCQGSLPVAVTDYHNLIYYHDSENLYVNLFVPSEVEWKGPNGMVTVTQETRFPEKDKVHLHVRSGRAGRFGIKFRVPQWAHDGVKVKVNNVAFKTPTIPGTWAVIERNWSSGDMVTLQFDLSPRMEPLSKYVSPAAVLCGPVVMVRSTARPSEDAIPTEGDLRFPADWLMSEDAKIAYSFSPSMKAPADRRRRLHTNQVMRPFYDIKAGEHYRMYFERSGRTTVSPDELVFHGDWTWDGKTRCAHESGCYFEGKFKGSIIVWEGLRGQDAGIAKVSIDGKDVAEVDQYGYTDVYVPRLDQREVPFRWSITNIGGGEHIIKVTILSHKNRASSGTRINVSNLVVYP
ncbi:MAG: beta-L-arabinofuranosidase domain-containing protein [Planctomycetota bacterium]|jgi:DUF1680 family protein